MDEDFAVLHALRVKGLATAEVLGELSGVRPEDLARVCAHLVEAGFVVSRAAAGYLPSPAGKVEAERLLDADEQTTDAREHLISFEDTFLTLNSEFKRIVHRWQLTADGQRNDHADSAYDAGVVAELQTLHTSAVPVVQELGAAIERFRRYPGRLDAALERVKGGDTASFARPMYNSYHDIWMELHNDVVLSLKRPRSAADER